MSPCSRILIRTKEGKILIMLSCKKALEFIRRVLHKNATMLLWKNAEK